MGHKYYLYCNSIDAPTKIVVVDLSLAITTASEKLDHVHNFEITTVVDVVF